ncbi:MAG: pyridoxamine 5'-phosphate oxidase family protein [Thermoleophilaceae bacterium]|nr:pyridoxamine 5'-phosphate oxidase family protein [Thermoleophilaceae bacterium]
MDDPHELGAAARAIVDSNLYMTLGTADREGRPWASPVYYAAAAYTNYFWVSSPEATHSRNLAVRPQMSIVIFDSQAQVGQGQAVYMSALAEELAGLDLERGIEVFSRRSQAHGAREWNAAEVAEPALHRLYRATACEHSVLDPASRGVDQRTPVTLAA